MSRKIRETKKNFKVFCEGDTEYNYIDEMKRQLKVSIALKTVNMKGGGYRNFLDYLCTDGDMNCLAKFIIVDGDRAIKEEGEQKNLEKLIEYCNLQNKYERTPHFLVVNYPDFEYVSCLHTPEYKDKGQDVKQYIEKDMGYKSVNEFKADKRIYHVLNNAINSKELMLAALKKKCYFVVNQYTVNREQYTIKTKVICKWDKLGYKGSNINDFFDVLSQFNT